MKNILKIILFLSFLNANIALGVESQSKPILYGNSISPYVRKIQVVLAEKNIEFEQHEVLPIVLLQATGQKIPKDFSAVSALGKIPAMKHGDHNISDSASIAVYIEMQYPQTKNLYPKQPFLYAQTLFFQNYADHILGAADSKIFMEKYIKPNMLKVESNKEVVNQVQNIDIPKIFAFLDQQLNGKKFLVAEKFTVADIGIAAHFINLKMVGITVNKKQYPNLAKYLDSILNRDSFKKYSYSNNSKE